jgi:tetratricopeptide (TPR) repeat protein
MLPLPVFLDAALLLETSQPVPRVNWFLYGMSIMVALVVIGAMSLYQPGSRLGVQFLSGLLLTLAMIFSAVWSTIAVRRHRKEVQAIEAIEEMIQLRRWEPAGILLNRFLSEPVRSPRIWARALVQLAALLGRHHRFEDAMSVQTFLIDHELLDDSSDYAVRLGRAMAMLREDHLVDADRAIGDLRRRVPAAQSGGLSLVEIFRDVKTGHPEEAIGLFADRLIVMQQQLGHRVADAHGLVAQAYDMLGRDDEAKAAYERATLLAPPLELHRRYPEMAKLEQKYPATVAPREAA